MPEKKSNVGNSRRSGGQSGCGIAVLPEFTAHAERLEHTVAAVGIVEARVQFRQALAVAERPSQDRKRC